MGLYYQINPPPESTVQISELSIYYSTDQDLRVTSLDLQTIMGFVQRELESLSTGSCNNKCYSTASFENQTPAERLEVEEHDRDILAWSTCVSISCNLYLVLLQSAVLLRPISFILFSLESVLLILFNYL